MKKFILACCVLLSACVNREVPKNMLYMKTIENTRDAATIIGYNEDSQVPLYDNDTSYVYSVDNKFTDIEKSQWNKEIALEPGKRMIGIQFRKGANTALQSFSLDVKPNHAYQVKHLSPSNIYEYRGGTIDIWIVERETGAQVTDVIRTYINSPQATQFMPVYINK